MNWQPNEEGISKMMRILKNANSPNQEIQTNINRVLKKNISSKKKNFDFFLIFFSLQNHQHFFDIQHIFFLFFFIKLISLFFLMIILEKIGN